MNIVVLYMQDVMSMGCHSQYIDTDCAAIGQCVAGAHCAAGAWLL